MTKARSTDLLAGGLFVVVALLLLAYLIPSGVVEPAKVKFAALSPSYYPRIISSLMLVIGICMLAGLLFRRRNDSITQPITNPVNDRNLTTKLLSLCAVYTVLFLYYWFLEYLGFVLLSILVLFVLLLLAGERRVPLICTISLLVPAALYFFFTEVANIPIPAGVLEPLLVGS